VRACFPNEPESAVACLKDAAAAERMAAIAKALGHPARLRIIRLLLEKQSCIGCDVVDEVRLAQSTVSEHLRILKAAGIITGAIEHPRVCYALDPEGLRPLARLLAAVLGDDVEGALGAESASLPDRHGAAGCPGTATQ
jgi:ArsR family transcriptional regulator, arsenate/arsenite/antimonite-responsive transcriptional repressor